MSDLILHHYAGSPFSEKMRLIFGFKNLSWQSVIVPVILPKPDVVALTGGYRRTPFLQIGADIYCDTALMCQIVERLHPAPSLYPAASHGVAQIVAHWADTDLFWQAIPYTMQPAGIAHVFAGVPPEVVQAFAADRAAMTAGMKRASKPDVTAALLSSLARLEHMLADQPFLCGAEASIADFAVAQSIWYIRRAPPMAGILDPFSQLAAWYERIAAFGHGQSSKLGSAEAIALARSSTPLGDAVVLPNLGFEAGDAVEVSATDYASDLIDGELVGLTTDCITLRRSDERAGTVHVHFPRIGYSLRSSEAKP
jgi:glutathione S-transferase